MRVSKLPRINENSALILAEMDPNAFNLLSLCTRLVGVQSPS